MEDDIRIGIRMARASDAPGIAEIFVDSWRETYAGILPLNGLLRMSKSEQAASWERTIAGSSLRCPTLVAADGSGKAYGFTSAGPSRDRSLPYEAEIYTLYVAPGFTAQGIGSSLTSSIFRLFGKANYAGLVIWALADNPSRYFYDSLGGRVIAERQHTLWGGTFREVAYGWRTLELGKSGQSVGRNVESGDTGD